VRWLLLFLLCACDKKEEPQTTQARAAPSAASSSNAGHPWMQACDAFLPPNLRATYLANMTVTAAQGPTCTFEDNSHKRIRFAYNCLRRVDDDAMRSALASVRDSDPSGKDIPNLGRGAVEVNFMGAQDQIHVFDDKTACKLLVGFDNPAPPNTIEIARAAVLAIRPELVLQH
jgi:hypothetical protein